MSIKVAVMAGTAVDTAMGAELVARGAPELDVLSYPVSGDPQSQTRFQLSPAEEKLETVGALLSDALSRGARAFFIYCNSLSGAVDFESLSRERGVPVVTPLQIYAGLGKRYARVGAIAANNQSLAGIERALMSGNPDAELIGVALLPIVKRIELRDPPERIVEQWRLAELASIMADCGAEAVILGCTHFPWFRDELARRMTLPLIDPAEEMLASLRASLA